MNFEGLLEKIKALASQHHDIAENEMDDFKDAETLELDAEDLIIKYCEKQGFLINGFPTEKKLQKEELDEDYFCRERYQLYLDTLLLEKSEIAEIMWVYTSNFWPDFFESKEDYITSVEEQIKCGVFYDVDLD